MKTTKYYTRDWFVALVIGIVFAAAAFTGSAALQRLELAAYDVGVRATHRVPGAAERIAIVAIDEPSLEELGHWPWPRSVLAEVLQRLTRAKAAAVGLLLDLTEPQIDPGLRALRDIREEVEAMAVPRGARAQLRTIGRLLARAENALATDRALARAMRPTPHLHLPVFVETAPAPAESAESKAPEYLERYRLANVAAPAADPPGPLHRAPPRIVRMRAPLEGFVRYTRGVGHLHFRADPDNGARALYASLRYGDYYYPSLAVLLTASGLNRDVRHVQLEPGQGVRIGKRFIPTGPSGLVYPGFYRAPPGQERAFSVYSFRDVHAGELPASLFTNKIVLIGPSANQLGPAFATPASDRAPEAEVLAHAVAGLLNQDFYTRPEWAAGAEIGIGLAVLLYLMFAAGRMRGKTAALVSLLLLLALLGAEQFLMVSEKVWLRAASPALLLLVGHLALAGKRFVLGERALIEAQTDSAESNRMLGLTFQAQGQLDLAMDKFRQLPVDESVLDLIYNLALDFERKRQFHKAVGAYDYILEHHSGFRDCAERKQRALQGNQTVVLGTLILDGAEKPTLGRYELEKELGRGAMGVVYLGRDPKINRQVAIKTMALSREFEEGEIAGARERFFREAETAGRLHHPNIVTIYDVGEEQDLAYIAMEYLEGKDLASYIQPDKPLPFDWIIEVAIKVADALAYAHENGVVHRDIKPTNIIYHEASRGVKVTDFGIAHVTDARRTKTGTVLGTPPYMSPEQIAGGRVDGRSDLFSFGSTLFELITGEMPFQGDSLAALMYQITNSPAPDIRKRRRRTPPALAEIVKRLLQKNEKKRYQSGAELKQDLERCRRPGAGSAQA